MDCSICSHSSSAYSFRFYFTPLSGFFSPFPHGTSSLSITYSIQSWIMVDPDSNRISRVRFYLRTYCNICTSFRIRGCNPLWLTFPGNFSSPYKTLSASQIAVNTPRNTTVPTVCPYSRVVQTVPVSLVTTQGISYLISFPLLLRYFSSQSVLPPEADHLKRWGFPIRKSRSMALLNSFSELIAVWRVLLRVQMSGHSLYALLQYFFHRFCVHSHY